MTELLLIVVIDGNRVALRASDVEAVVELEALIPVPRATTHVAGLSALRSRVLTVVDCRRSLELGETPRTESFQPAVVVSLDGHPYALEVDAVDDVVDAIGSPMALRMAMSPGWERVALGIVETAEGPLLLADIGAIIAGPPSRSITLAA